MQTVVVKGISEPSTVEIMLDVIFFVDDLDSVFFSKRMLLYKLISFLGGGTWEIGIRERNSVNRNEDGGIWKILGSRV